MITYANVKTVSVLSKLTQELVQATQAKLNKDQVTEIVNWSWSGGDAFGKEDDNQYGEFDLSDVSPEIYVTHDVDNFAGKVQLQEYKMSHSWAGDDTAGEWGFRVYGNVKFGATQNCKFYDNGNLSSSTEESIDGQFDVNQVQVVLIHREEHDHYNGRCHDDDIWTLNIYIPGGRLIDEKTYAIAKEYGFLGKLA